MSHPSDPFSSDYVTARARFRERAHAAGMTLRSLVLFDHIIAADFEPLTLDVAYIGAESPRRALVVSSGTHGVEGFFGSAVQLAVLNTPELLNAPDDCAVVLLHGLNPFGFDRIRRVNEDNVDLNRNFLLSNQSFSGSPDGYARLDPLLNPPSAPREVEPFLLQVGYQIARYGMPALKTAVATGQYDFPRGLFYGGGAPVRSQTLLADLLPKLFTGTERVMHVDLHTGSGAWCTYVCAVDLPSTDARFQYLSTLFGADRVEGFDPNGVLYEIRGALGTWCQEQLPDTEYLCVLAEFGTYSGLKVISAMRAENRAWLYTDPGDPRRIAARKRLLETFCPADPLWRREMVAKGVEVVAQARAALSG